MNGYRKLMMECARDKMSCLLSNANPDNYRFFLLVCFKYSDNTIRAYVDNGKDIIPDNHVLSEAADFLKQDPNRKIEVVLKDNSKKSVKLELLQNDYPHQCVVHTLPDNYEDKPNSFILLDETGYRYRHDRLKPDAVVTFYSPDIAEHLAKEFKGLFKELGEEQGPQKPASQPNRQHSLKTKEIG